MTTNPDVDSLAGLEFEISCRCSQHQRPCLNRATHIVRIHALHACNGSDLDPDGNRVELRCFECLLRLCAEVGERVNDHVSRWGYGQCEGCGAPIASVGDMVRNWEAL